MADSGEMGISSSATFMGSLKKKLVLRRTGSSSSCQERFDMLVGFGGRTEELEMDESVEDCELKGCVKASAGSGKMLMAGTPEASAPPYRCTLVTGCSAYPPIFCKPQKGRSSLWC